MSRPRLSRTRRSLPPRFYRGPGERREYVLAAGLVAGLQGAIAVSLAICAAQTYRMWQHGVAYLPGEVARVVPVALVLGAAVAAAATLRSVRSVQALRRIPLEGRERPASGGDNAP